MTLPIETNGHLTLTADLENHMGLVVDHLRQKLLINWLFICENWFIT
jgi:hypothetical protein